MLPRERCFFHTTTSLATNLPSLPVSTTVGYGDIHPEHTTGKVIVCPLMLVGIGFVAIITGAIAQRFLSGEVAEVEEAVETVEQVDAYVLREVREISQRLRALETAVERRLSSRS